MLRILNKLQVISLMLLFKVHIRICKDFFTSVTELEYLLLPHERIIIDLQYYVNIQEKKLLILKRYSDLYVKEHNKILEDCNLNNSLHMFILIKRLVTDLDHLPVLYKIGKEFIPYLLVKHVNITYPDHEDLVGAAQALTRLHKLYNLNIKDLSKGNLNNLAYTTPMTAGDCFELALVLEGEDYKTGHKWMIEARRKYYEENVCYPFTEVDMLEYLSKVNDLLSGHTTSSVPAKITILDLKDSEAEEIVLRNYEKSIPELALALEMAREMKEVTRTEKEEKMFMNYEATCRGDLAVPTKISNRLKCRYLTESNPFLKLAPFKVEMMYLNPDIFLLHDVLSDSEIETIKQITKLRLKRAQVNDPKTGYLHKARFRISKVAWFEDEDSAIARLITRRVAHMTGLSMGLSGDFQVVNYGIGGHYEPHFDFPKKEEKFAPPDAWTMATVLFYMTDVAQGGATVFPELGVRLLPVKGTAAMWFNLHPSLEGNYAMRHAACPVLQGDKWALVSYWLRSIVCSNPTQCTINMNPFLTQAFGSAGGANKYTSNLRISLFSKFIKVQDQIFVKPCTLEYQEEGFYKKILEPELKTAT